MKRSTTAQRLREIMDARCMRQVDILKAAEPYCKKYSVKLEKNALSQYLSGRVEPGQQKLTILALALNVSEAWLMGYDVPMARTVNTETSPTESEAKRCFEALSEAHKAEALNFLRYLATREDRE